MAKLVPLIVILTGVLGGGGAGWFLKPPAPAVSDAGADAADQIPRVEEAHADEKSQDVEYVKLNNQFVVPVLDGGRVQSLVVMSLSLEVDSGGREQVFSKEPKLRDALLSALFEHANIGGFDGTFTDNETMRLLRRSLRQTAQTTLGDLVRDVLVIDIVRQDID